MSDDVARRMRAMLAGKRGHDEVHYPVGQVRELLDVYNERQAELADAWVDAAGLERANDRLRAEIERLRVNQHAALLHLRACEVDRDLLMPAIAALSVGEPRPLTDAEVRRGQELYRRLTTPDGDAGA